MGNQLVGVAPAQIYPVEHYLSDHPNLTFDQSLGSTRFFKVARARSREGLIVVKVFAIQDPSLPLGTHKDRLERMREQLAGCFNCLPFQKIILTDKAGLIMREYCKFSLYDRMSTRPFLSILEKKWITFQVLYALHQCHKLGVCHGDIKLENIMLTSWTWVLLTDFASFKPTFLPEDNPADYSYFFDTSRRRLCYVAPERFVSTLDNRHKLQQGSDGGGLLLNESPCKAGDLLPSMDIFSAGCALLELWNDGTPALDLSGLLAYRHSDERPPSMKLPQNADQRLRDLLYSMTQRNPQERLSADVYLDNERGQLFPEYFYSFLQSYMLIFSSQPILPPDEKIFRIHQDIKSIIRIFTQASGERNYKELADETTDERNYDNISELMREGFKVKTVRIADRFEPESRQPPAARHLGPDSDGLLFVTTLVTSCVRGLHHCTSKLNALDIMAQLCDNSSSETILDRILPYIIYLTHDPLSRVRVAALDTLTACVSLIRSLPKSDSNVFPEYILQEIAPRALDPRLAVRVAIANNIAQLAETALRFLDESQCVDNLKESAKINYESELSALHEMVRSTVSSLLTDPQALVRRALVENGISKLCVFFGKQKANDVILSHVVTFLNDKEEAALRACFFDCIVGVAAYVGSHCASILLPLLQQGLTDQSEFVIAKALGATSALAELGLLQKQALCEIIAESVCYLAHPNMWIRHEICGLISCVASLLNPIDVNCKILPLVWPHLRHKLTQVDKPELLLESLVEPIPRNILDTVMKYRDINQLIETLRERRVTRQLAKQGVVPQYTESGHVKNIFRRLTSDGLTDHMESQLLAMSAHLIKIQRAASHSGNQNQNEAPGKLVLSNASGLSKTVNLDVGTLDPHIATDKNYNTTRRTPKTSVSACEPHSHMNTEWQHMFAHPQSSHQSSRGFTQDNRYASTFTSSTLQSSGNTVNVPSTQSLSTGEQSAVRERSYVQYNMAPCRVELRSLTARMQQKYMKSLSSSDISMEGSDQTLPPPTWRPGNTLLAYLHEHRASVNRLVTLPSGRLFGSCSSDGTVRLWDASKLEGNSLVNKSKSMYNRSAGPVVALAPCESGQSFVAATQDGSIFVLRLDSNSSRMTLSQCRQLEPSEEGGAVDVTCCTSGFNANLITYATLYGGIVGWDLRAPGNAWKLQTELKKGVYTCLYSHPAGWLCVGTCNGNIDVWDLRFQLPITTITHPNEERVRRVCGWGADGSRIWSCGGRDAGAWCMESTARTHAVWPVTANSPRPLLYDKPASHYVSAIYCGYRNNSNFLVSGGSDQRIRYWDLDHPSDSYVLLHAHNDTLKNASLKYSSRLIDGTSVLQEWCKVKPEPQPSEESIYKTLENRSYYHTAPITDITMVQASKCYLVSASADGVINVWK